MAHATTLVRDRLTAGLFLAGAAIGLVGNGLHPHTADTDPASAIDAIAGSDRGSPSTWRSSSPSCSSWAAWSA